MSKLYALHDNDENLKKQGAFKIQENEVEGLNKLGYGIFQAVNEFNGARKAANCTKVCYWYADLDEGTKEEQKALIEKLPLQPSLVVETKKGFHCYFEAIDATIENFSEIEKGLIKRLNADKHCTDVSRLLRYPYTYHMKNPKEPFLITAEATEFKYTESQMLCAYKLPKAKVKPLKIEGGASDFIKPENWERIFKISRIYEGGRNATLVRYALWMIDLKLPSQQICYVVEGLNDLLSKPLPDWEIKQLLKGKGLL